MAAVFSASCLSCIADLICSISVLRLPSVSFFDASSASEFLSFVSFCDIEASNSSISLRRPRRLLLFLNAPPDIEPPELNISPSSVTILSECLYFLAIARALSIWSTTRILPRRYLANSSNSLSHSTSWLAKPIAPFSPVSAESTLTSLPLIAERGRKVARPYLFCFRKAISSFAVSSLSVTMF